MGVKQFFLWLQKNHSQSIYNIKNGDLLSSHVGKDFDNLLLDMNGLYHSSAQYVFRYGKNKADYVVKDTHNNRKKFYQHVCDTINYYFMLVKPKKHIVMCVDGVAPVSKQNQMRSRRLRANENAEKGGFDSNNISVGTKMMQHLSQYIDTYIKRMITENEYWKHIKVIFSSDKVAGEGEHKLIKFIRDNMDDTHCFNGLDADLIMLGLATECQNLYILRDCLYDRNFLFYIIDMNKLRDSLIEILKWKSNEHTFKENTCIKDFVFMCFLVGNDFLPHIPCIEIVQQGIETLIDIYKSVCKKEGHIVKKEGDILIFNNKVVRKILKKISEFEKLVLENKLNGVDFNGKSMVFFPDEISEEIKTEHKVPVEYEKDKTVTNITYELDITLYREKYNEKHIDGIEETCNDYFDGLIWVLNYYNGTVLSWDWCFNYHYAPFASDMCHYLKNYVPKIKYEESKPSELLLQLVCILPKHNASFLPENMMNFFEEPKVQKYFCDYKIDLTGMRAEWEGIPLIPFINRKKIYKLYDSYKEKLNDVEKKRNEVGETYFYFLGDKEYTFKTYYNEIITSKTKRVLIAI